MSKLGIIAGGGQLPRDIIQACQNINRPFYIIGFEGQTDSETLKNKPHFITKVGKIGEILNKLKSEQIYDLVLIGNFTRPSWFELKPDATAAKWLAGSAKSIFGDDSLLKLISSNLEREGFRLWGIEEIIANNILMPKGQIGSIEPDQQALTDIKHGIKIAQLLGQGDIGQSVIVQQNLVLGVEAIEGTDELMTRCGLLKRTGPGGVLVKILKPDQEGRIDRPTIGLETVRKAIKSGLRGLALESQAVIVCNLKEMIQLADDNHFFILGFEKILYERS